MRTRPQKDVLGPGLVSRDVDARAIPAVRTLCAPRRAGGRFFLDPAFHHAGPSPPDCPSQSFNSVT
jgi:hypothetical protein